VGWLGAQYAYAAGAVHAVSSVDRGEYTDSFAYDANGNMTQRIENGVEWTQTFNAENRLASVSDGTDTWTFIYDGAGNRVKQINPDGKISLFLGGGIYTVVDASGNPEVTKYYSVAGQRVAMRTGSTTSYLLTDHLGSVSGVLDASGALASEQRYLPFGGERPSEGITETDFGYTGQRNLAAAGLMDYNARWYSQTVGVFTQPDMFSNFMNPQGLNRYGYVGDNPLNWTDPSGNTPITCSDDNTSQQCQSTHTGAEVNLSKPTCTNYHCPPQMQPTVPTLAQYCKANPGSSICFMPHTGTGNSNSTGPVGPGYEGPLPDNLVTDLVRQGADRDLLDDVTLHVETGPCYFDSDSVAETIGYSVAFCQPGNFNPEAPNGILVHELLHVSQFDTNPIGTIANVAYYVFMGLVDPNYNRYDDPNTIEFQGNECQRAYDRNQNILLDTSPCPIQ
jgi:RHS repeat-associated protein